MSTLKEIKNASLLTLLRLTFKNSTLRKQLVKIADKRVYNALVENNNGKFLKAVQEDKYYIVSNLMFSVHRAMNRGIFSQDIVNHLTDIFIGELFLPQDNQRPRDAFKQKYGSEPPAFITLSPTGECNLKCIGCYAASDKYKKIHLPFSTCDRIITDMKKEWGDYFVVISGGEPLMYHSEGKGIIDLFEKHNDVFFLMFTNGTLITEDVAKRLSEAGNITPTISVEGMEEETDKRRGKGVFKRILKAMENLRKYQVPMGLSMTATRENYEKLLADETIDFFIEQGIIHFWIFQYMPIGRSYTLELLVTPEQRKNMFIRERKLLREKKIFIADFWNSGPMSDGCIAGGRQGGYLYIDWNGNVYPCVFIPYYNDNITDVYKSGGKLSDILFSPIFKSVRKWQKEYGWHTPPQQTGNLILPCFIRDHFENAYTQFINARVEPGDENASEALSDTGYIEGMKRYDIELGETIDPIWEKHYRQKS